ncbi:hypothetical protein CAPTEDRAFT_204557 [Capitella teleta]|uniref:Uncharacterized protein n=1 Tax=Capitella teleta TaxID=283909 RepID=R7U2W8_CAPTE|nr:hypothetical protein CAPTEDRAFT_204557 [Capitella teleta]|eukprot:ELT98011.1 hypothetical protein CAPTEDRAFT_204557 [Capitella teleta]
MASGPAYTAFINDGDPQGPTQFDQTVPLPGTPAVIHLQAPPRFSWSHVVLAAIGYLCCPIFGLVALVAALTSYTDHKAKDFIRAHSKRRVALGFALAAIIMGIATVVLFAVGGNHCGPLSRPERAQIVLEMRYCFSCPLVTLLAYRHYSASFPKKERRMTQMESLLPTPSAHAGLKPEQEMAPSIPFPYDHRVVIASNTNERMQEQDQPKNWNGVLCLAIAGYFSCPVIGIVGLLAALTSYTDHRVKDYVRSNRKHKVVLYFSSAAVIVFSLFIGLYIFLRHA